jgi:APA family basic amino acid/polyamine antiporter
VLGFLSCAYLMWNLSLITWEYFGGWMAAGLVIYFGYGYRRSRLATASQK